MENKIPWSDGKKSQKGHHGPPLTLSICSVQNLMCAPSLIGSNWVSSLPFVTSCSKYLTGWLCGNIDAKPAPSPSTPNEPLTSSTFKCVDDVLTTTSQDEYCFVSEDHSTYGDRVPVSL